MVSIKKTVDNVSYSGDIIVNGANKVFNGTISAMEVASSFPTGGRRLAELQISETPDASGNRCITNTVREISPNTLKTYGEAMLAIVAEVEQLAVDKKLN